MTDLLPPNATVVERNLARAGAAIDQIPVRIRDIYNPDACPEEFLPFLANHFSVDHWIPSWPLAIKRAVIRASFAVHKQKGTISALRHTLQHVSAGIRVREWFESDPPGPRGTFTLDLDVLDTGITGAMYEEIDRLVEDAAPVTRHMTGLTITVGLRGASPIAAAIHQGDTMTIDTRQTGEIDVHGNARWAIRLHEGETLTIYSKDAS